MWFTKQRAKNGVTGETIKAAIDNACADPGMKYTVIRMSNETNRMLTKWTCDKLGIDPVPPFGQYQGLDVEADDSLDLGAFTLSS